MILAPMVKDRKGEYQDVFDDLRKQGYARVRVDGKIHDLSEDIKLDKNKKHSIEVVVDRLVIGQSGSQQPHRRFGGNGAQSWAAAWCWCPSSAARSCFSRSSSPAFTAASAWAKSRPRTFSFNSPHGACPACTGLGFKLEIDPDLVLNKELSVMEGAIRPWQTHNWYLWRVEPLARQYGFSLDTPVKDFTPGTAQCPALRRRREPITYRNRFGRMVRRYDGFEGVIPTLERALPRYGIRRLPAEHRAVHGAQALPGLQGQALKAGSRWR